MLWLKYSHTLIIMLNEKGSTQQLKSQCVNYQLMSGTHRSWMNAANVVTKERDIVMQKSILCLDAVSGTRVTSCGTVTWYKPNRNWWFRKQKFTWYVKKTLRPELYIYIYANWIILLSQHMTRDDHCVTLLGWLPIPTATLQRSPCARRLITPEAVDRLALRVVAWNDVIAVGRFRSISRSIYGWLLCDSVYISGSYRSSNSKNPRVTELCVAQINTAAWTVDSQRHQQLWWMSLGVARAPSC